MPSSEEHIAPSNATAAPTAQLHDNRLAEPRSPARNPVVPKIPMPIMLETTSAVALITPSWRRRAGFAAVVATSVLILPPATTPPAAPATFRRHIHKCHP